MTKNGPIFKTKTVLESGECTDHFSSMEKLFNSQSPLKNHPSSTSLPKKEHERQNSVLYKTDLKYNFF